jgi:hypothetical protein
MKLSNSIIQPTHSFASVMLALSLFGFLWPHRSDSVKGGRHANFVQQNQVQPNDDDSWYTLEGSVSCVAAMKTVVRYDRAEDTLDGTYHGESQSIMIATMLLNNGKLLFTKSVAAN